MSRKFPAPRAAYVHVPFCRHRCGYCNFTLVAGRDDLVGEYLRAIELEMAGMGHPHEVDSIFFGGGTPTHLGAERFRSLLSVVSRWYPLAEGGELTVEANPADLNEGMLQTLADSGVTRLSIGGQSFHPAKLAALERDHTAEQLSNVVKSARGLIHSISLDLIFATPGETLSTWQADLDMAVALAPDHVSTYGLTFERGTAFWKRLLVGELGRLDEECERSMYAAAIDSLTTAGVEHYEVSNFARAGHRCRHNETYWAGQSYFAVGPGAARYVDGRREMNHRSTTTWLKRVLAGQSPMADSESLEPEDRAREMLVFGLRRIEGVDRAEFAAAAEIEVDSLVAEPLARMVELGLLADDGRRIRLTRAGLFVSDAIWPHFLRR
ncbi:MAG TPA: radical SAM family heme chaperone HemW [Pirellulales bacterium]|jgi:oxygen-independent coproporphyrinogen-3 oxidase|nr:radical SAM family heme chaperone HemW [Pirellulales bacterium]